MFYGRRRASGYNSDDLEQKLSKRRSVQDNSASISISDGSYVEKMKLTRERMMNEESEFNREITRQLQQT